MNFNWKHKAGALALSAALLSVTATGPAEAKGKSGVIKPRDDVAPPSAEKGIKDKGMTSCGNCGLTGKEAAPPPVDDGAAPAPSVDIETGQLLIKDKPNPPSAAKKKKSRPKERDDAVYSTTLRVLGGVVGIAALALAVGNGGGNDNPTSP